MESKPTGNQHRVRGTGRGGGAVEALPNSGSNHNESLATPPELLLQWGSRKRLRCVKFQHKDNDAAAGNQATATTAAAARADRALRRATSAPYKQALRNNLEVTEAAAIRGKRGGTSPERERGVEAGGSASMDGAQKAAAWPKLALSLTNKEKEEDFLVFKGSKLPQRPKKRAKLLQRTINLVSPGAWLCDLTLDRYEVREKKISKKKPRGLKAMGNMESDSE
ncbi:hypothetical protein MUK42_07789 [Musa troglodytarum]|uniref:DUF1639 family protein n=1 Tax=Musa troglodytarum TaxID=320322 RepID=A0A9E7EEB1_9LILI|nr:hypothetical protein MUK42_07789 [Musa troglodytarum]